jgi:hypothetical protein
VRVPILLPNAEGLKEGFPQGVIREAQKRLQLVAVSKRDDGGFHTNGTGLLAAVIVTVETITVQNYSVSRDISVQNYSVSRDISVQNY